jgi:NADPH:quinone reductase-like Zn-dependent oxidoreductase
MYGGKRAMRAVVIREFDAAPEIADLPVPRPRAGEVLIKVAASSVNGIDEAVAEGWYKEAMAHRFPVVLGMDVAGTVTEAGDGVTRLRAGDRVFGVIVNAGLGAGAFAEYAAVRAEHNVAKLPDNVRMADAGALGLAGIAAYDAVLATGPRKGETVLISGAAGGDGAYAVQMAAARGAEVIATARSGEEAAFVKALGAQRSVDYTGDAEADAGTMASVEPGGIDVILHFGGDATGLGALLKPGGRFASTLGASPRRDDVETYAIRPRVSRQTLNRLSADVVDGQLVVPVTRTYKLAEATDALRDFRRGAMGKYAIDVNSLSGRTSVECAARATHSTDSLS